MNYKNVLFALFYCFSCFYLISCECNKVECDVEETNLYIQIVSSLDSTDLVFGEHRIYDIDSIKVYELDVSDTTFFNLKTAVDLNLQNYLTFDYENFQVSRVFMDLGNTDIDTLDLTFQSTDTQCCGKYTYLNILEYNGTQVYDSSSNGFLITLRK